MPSVEKMGRNKFRAIWQENVDGKRVKKQSTAPYFSRSADARDYAIDQQSKANKKVMAEKGTISAKITWGELWEMYIESRTYYSDAKRKRLSIARCFLLPQWEEKTLNKISKITVQKWLDELKAKRKANGTPLAPSYIRTIYDLFCLSINFAVSNEILENNPCKGIKRPNVPKKSKPFYSYSDAIMLASSLPDICRDVVDFMYETGLRPGEAAGLHASHINLAAGWLIVADTYVFGRKMMRPWPKDKDHRTIPLTQKAVDIIQRNIGDRDLSQLCGVPHMIGECPGALVFVPKGKRVIGNEQIGNALRAAAAKTGMKVRSPYSVRRGFATRLAGAGVDPFTIARLMGHSSLDQTQEYVQETEGMRKRVLAALVPDLSQAI